MKILLSCIFLNLLTNEIVGFIDNRGTSTVYGCFQLQGQYHFTLEPQTTVCIPNEDELDVYCSTQWVNLVQTAISQCIGIPENRINIHVKRLGGAFGCKISRASQVACACALASKLTNLPVRFVLNIESNMLIMGKRCGLVNEYKVTFDENGKIQNLLSNFWEDYGCSMNESLIFLTESYFKNCYINNNWKVEGKPVMTDSPSNTWCRGPGSTEGISMIENIMEHIAWKLNKDPVQIRLSNISDDNKMKKLIPEFLKSIDYYNRKTSIDKFNKTSRWKKRGIAMVPMEYLQIFLGSIPVVISIYHNDGTVVIHHGGIECGQGINTKVIQVAAHTLDIPMSYITVKPQFNCITPNSSVTGGGMTSDAVCFATIKTCQILLERIKPIRDQMKNAEWFEITKQCHKEFIDLSASYVYKGTDLEKYFIWGLSSAEVEVDALTGTFLLTRVDILEDTGESLNPFLDIGQVEGAFVMGLGYWLTENLKYDKNSGKLNTNRAWNYFPPGPKDIPIDFRVNFLQNSSNKKSILRSKSTGEPAFCMAVVVIFALRYAIQSARGDARLSDTWFNLGAPTTPEEILIACGTNLENLKI